MKAFWRFSITMSEKKNKKIVEISRFECVAKNIKG
jgi:hypothetical protein